MVQNTIDLKSEERRRQQTLAALGVLLFATTLPVVNQRALFSPLGDVPILGDLTPVAYAAIFGPANGGERGRGPGGRGPGGAPPPVAFALRVPRAPANGVPPGVGGAVPAQNVANVPPLAAAPPGFGVGEAPPGSGGGGGGGSTGGGGGGGGGNGGGGGGATPGPIGAVPEPATWLTMIMGFAVVGVVMRRARRRAYPAVARLSAG